MAIKRSVLGLIAVVGLLASPMESTARAQEVEVSGPLAGAPAVMRMRVYREGRFQLQLPHVAMTLQDEFTRALFVGGQAQYHITDWLGIGVWGGFAAAQLQTALTDEVTLRGSTNERNTLSLPTRQGFPDQIGSIKYIGALQATFIPLRGKLGLFEKLFVDTDFYLFGGVAFVGIQERADVVDGQCRPNPATPGVTPIDCVYSQTGYPGGDPRNHRADRSTIAPTFGAGLSLYITNFLALTLEWRAVPFAWNTSGTDEAGDTGLFPDGKIDSQDRLMHFNHMVSLGFAWYLPFEPGISHAELE